MPPYLSGMDIEEIAEMQRRGKLIAEQTAEIEKMRAEMVHDIERMAAQAAQITALRAALVQAEAALAEDHHEFYASGGYGKNREGLVARVRAALAATKEGVA